jgi:hypothetical protein
MEGIDILIQAISNVGFPIAISIYLIYTSSKRDEKFTATIEELRQTVNNNTAIITRLYEKLGKE